METFYYWVVGGLLLVGLLSLCWYYGCQCKNKFRS